MNLQPYYAKQKEQDDIIMNGINVEDLLLKRINSFLVELGELQNELPSLFKYWSKKEDNREKALIEYIDGLKFLLSIGNLIRKQREQPQPVRTGHILRLFGGLYNMGSMLMATTDGYEQLVDNYIALAKRIGFTEDEILKAYDEKYQVNVERVESGVY